LTLNINALIAVVSLVLFGVVGYANFARRPQAPPAATAENCSADAIRKVVAPVERAILSAHCNKLAYAPPGRR